MKNTANTSAVRLNIEMPTVEALNLDMVKEFGDSFYAASA